MDNIVAAGVIGVATGSGTGSPGTGIIAGISAASLLALVRAVVAIVREYRAWRERKGS